MKLIIAVKIESDHNDFELQPTSKLTFLQRFPTAASSIDWVKFKMTKMNITSFQSSKWRISFQNQFQLAFIVSLHLSAFSYFYWPEIKIRSFDFFSNSKEFFEHVIYLRVTVRLKFTSALDIWLHWNRLYKT